MTAEPKLSMNKLIWILLISLVLACNFLTNTPEPTLAPVDTPVMISPSAMPPPEVDPSNPTVIPFTETPSVEPTNIPAPSGPAILPASLYFLNSVGQIMRLEADGITISQITAEPEPVTDFDVSPVDSHLVFISGNSLIEADSTGNNRIIKIIGEPIDPNESEDFVTKSISAPRFSPDGSQIVFGLNGINIIPSGAASEYEVIVASDPYPDISNQGVNSEGPIRFFFAAEWSPDGTRLVLQISYFPEAGGLAIHNLLDETLTELNNPTEGITCCSWSWTADSQGGYIASDLIAYGAPGLVFFDATSGQGTTLIAGLPPNNVEPSPENPIRLFKSAFPTTDGSILTFASVLNNFDGFGSAGVYSMYRFEENGGSLTPARTDSHPIWEILWARDGAGAVIVDTLFTQQYPPTGPMRWLPADGRPALNLPANGSHARWGSPSAIVTTTQDPAEANFANLEAQALTDFNLELSETGINGLRYGRLNLGDGRSLWFIHTIGLRDFNNQQHAVGIYAFDNGNWQRLAINILPDFEETEGIPGPDFLAQRSVQQVFIEPTNGWLSVEGGIGAHGGTLHILRFDGQSLVVEAENSNGSPGAGYTEDLNNDGRQEVLLDMTDYYIFSYAAGVRLINYTVLRWDGSALVPVILTRLENINSANELNNQAINLTEAQLWKDARELINEARLQAPDDETIRWNAALITTIAGARENARSSFPIMDWVFYGDYQTVIESMRSYSPAELFNRESPLIIGTSADGSIDLMADRIWSFTSSALVLKPNLASAHFLRGWAAYLLDPNDPTALEAVREAAVLEPENEFYVNAAAYLQP